MRKRKQHNYYKKVLLILKELAEVSYTFLGSAHFEFRIGILDVKRLKRILITWSATWPIGSHGNKVF